MTESRYGVLNCLVADGGPSPDIAVVMCHGYGAPGDDLAGLSQPWIQMLGDDAGRFRFVFPAAPSTLADLGMPDGRAWWPLNMARMIEAMQANDFEQLHQHEPPGITHARTRLCETIRLVKEDLAGDATPLILGGFSQGAMLTMETALRGTITPPELLVQFSGTVVCQPEWESAMDRLSQTKVYQSHGQHDPILPYAGALRMQELLQKANVDVQFHSFMGPHTIDQESIANTVEAFREVAK